MEGSTDGTVKAKVNGEYKVVDIQIDENTLKTVDESEKMIIFAVNDAVDKTKVLRTGNDKEAAGWSGSTFFEVETP